MNYNDGYYHLKKDLLDYPDAVIYVAWSFRGPGKTYSALRMCKEEKIKFIYLKRTADDVDLLCAASSGKAIEVDASPFVPLNRDFGWNIKPVSLKKGIGAFCDMDKENKDPIGIILALSKTKSIKGVDFSDVDIIILDEFVPQVHEIIRKKEFEALMDFMLTASRDRIARGRKPLKLILFANSENIACPITSGLEIMDHMAEMTAARESIRYLEDRHILLHHILPEEAWKVSQSQKKDGIYDVMAGTDWARKAYEGDFANNDFSNVRTMSMKNMIPFIQLKYKNKNYYIYYREDGIYYMCFNKAKCPRIFDLDKENDQKLFWAEECQSLRVDCMEGRFAFQKYSMYDLIINYKNYFKV
ncbi:MAG: phage DNA encapsidation protein [Bacteroidales bacterium]|nr:phage DNA encapsidation protein [Bacteroidales bacterium]